MEAADRRGEASVRSPCKQPDHQPSFVDSAQPKHPRHDAVARNDNLLNSCATNAAQQRLDLARQPATAAQPEQQAREPVTSTLPAQAVSQSSQSPRKQQQVPGLPQRMSDIAGLRRQAGGPGAVQRRVNDPASLRRQVSVDAQAGLPARKTSFDSSDRVYRQQARLNAQGPLHRPQSAARPGHAGQPCLQMAVSSGRSQQAPAAAAAQAEAGSPDKPLKATPRSIAAARCRHTCLCID